MPLTLRIPYLMFTIPSVFPALLNSYLTCTLPYVYLKSIMEAHDFPAQLGLGPGCPAAVPLISHAV